MCKPKFLLGYTLVGPETKVKFPIIFLLKTGDIKDPSIEFTEESPC